MKLFDSFEDTLSNTCTIPNFVINDLHTVEITRGWGFDPFNLARFEKVQSL